MTLEYTLGETLLQYASLVIAGLILSAILFETFWGDLKRSLGMQEPIRPSTAQHLGRWRSVSAMSEKLGQLNTVLESTTTLMRQQAEQERQISYFRTYLARSTRPSQPKDQDYPCRGCGAVTPGRHCPYCGRGRQ